MFISRWLQVTEQCNPQTREAFNRSEKTGKITNACQIRCYSTRSRIFWKLSSVNKNNSSTTFCSEFSAFLKPFSVNCDWRMLILNMIWAHLNCTANKFQAILSIVCFHWTPSKFYTILRSVQRMLTMPVHLMEADLRTSQPTTSVKVQIGGHRFGP